MLQDYEKSAILIDRNNVGGRILMDVFKVRQGNFKRFRISEKNYIKETGNDPIYFQKNQSGGVSYFAVCPECENPIQLIGLFKNTKESGRRAYGKHTGHDIPAIALHCEEDYLSCIYAKPNYKRAASNKKNLNSHLVQRILRLLMNQFDHIIDILSKDMQMRITYPTAEKMLNTYLQQDGFLYRDSTLNNLPWKFAHATLCSCLFGRQIVRDGDLHATLQDRCPDIVFEDTFDPKYVAIENKSQQYLDIRYGFYGHKREFSQGRLQESIQFWVYRGKPSHVTTIYEKTISIVPELFASLMHIPASNARRNTQYLTIAKQLITPLLHQKKP